MKLDLEIETNLSRGRQPKPLSFEVERDITEADLAMLSTLPADASTPPPIKSLTDRHHMLARLLAGGMTEGQAAVACGYDPSRVSILKNSPAFEELLSFYRGKEDEHFVSVLDHMAGLSLDAVMELRNRVEESPEDFSNKDLLAIISDMADRTGAPKKKEVSKTIDINMGDRLNAAKERAKLAMQKHMKVIEAEDVIDADFQEVPAE